MNRVILQKSSAILSGSKLLFVFEVKSLKPKVFSSTGV